MKFRRLGLGSIALASASVLVLAGCASGGGGGGGGASGGTGGGGGIITANGSEPQNPLIPTNTNETGGGKILDSIFAGLVTYAADGSPSNDMAQSIETDDNQTFTITVAEGNTFTNGDPVNAESFVNAWQYGALLSNEQLNSYFFEDIQGFSYDVDSELTGLQVTGDYTFTVTLNQPRSDFPLRLGYSAFYPLPPVAFEDMAAFGENPIGNGPYKLASEGAWQHDVQIDLVANPDYSGPRAAQNDGLSIIFYATQEAAYADLIGGNLDVLDAIPDAAFTTFEDDLGDRAINQPAAIFQSFTIPSDPSGFANPDAFKNWVGQEGQLRRQAVSMAINRQEITDVIFQGTRTPASDFTSPTIAGWTDQLAGAGVLDYNPDEAKRLWAEADAISPFEGAFQISYNADGGHQGWVDAVANSVANTLGIQASGNPIPTFGEARQQVTGKTIETAFRTGWQADYPGLFNFLGPLYATNASSNDGDYSNPEVDALLQQGATTTDPAEANALYQQAQEILLQDLPAIPLWYSNVTGGYGESVSNVEFGWNSVPLYNAITKNA